MKGFHSTVYWPPYPTTVTSGANIAVKRVRSTRRPIIVLYRRSVCAGSLMRPWPLSTGSERACCWWRQGGREELNRHLHGALLLSRACCRTVSESEVIRQVSRPSRWVKEKSTTAEEQWQGRRNPAAVLTRSRFQVVAAVVGPPLASAVDFKWCPPVQSHHGPRSWELAPVRRRKRCVWLWAGLSLSLMRSSFVLRLQYACTLYHRAQVKTKRYVRCWRGGLSPMRSSAVLCITSLNPL